MNDIMNDVSQCKIAKNLGLSPSTVNFLFDQAYS